MNELRTIERTKTETVALPADRAKAFGCVGGGTVEVTYGLSSHFEQQPYFSITGRVKSNKEFDGSTDTTVMAGTIHDLISEFFPHLAHLIKWHLTRQDGTPMRYLANGEYWLGGYKKWGEPATDPVAAFAHTVILGVIEGEQAPEPKEFKAWALARLPKVKEAFLRDMQAAGVTPLQWTEGRGVIEDAAQK
jgi:hypothetical protein